MIKEVKFTIGDAVSFDRRKKELRSYWKKIKAGMIKRWNMIPFGYAVLLVKYYPQTEDYLGEFKVIRKMTEVPRMAFKEVVGNPVFRFENKDDSIEGVYLGAVEGKFGKDYEVEDKEGIKTIFGNTVLATKLLNVKAGSKIRISYLGEVKSKEGRLYKDFKVEVDE